MKYFTHELVERYGSSDDRIADEAEAEWELAIDAYRKHLKKIDSKLPKSVRSFLSQHCLHDARLVNLMVNGTWFSLLFRIGNPRMDRDLARKNGHGQPGGLMLRYDLPEGVQPTLIPHRGRERGIELEWLYDEIDVKGSGEKRLFTHSILMTAGFELQIPFHDLRMEPYTRFLAGARSIDPEQVDDFIKDVA